MIDKESHKNPKKSKMSQELIKDIVCKAINNKHRIMFFYNEKLRIGEPQCCGITTADKEAVRIHLIQGGKKPEQLF
jgi:hypothetical protein